MVDVLNRSAYLVLGMIQLGFTSGYDISKHAELASRFFWAAGDGQVYPQLSKLSAAGLIDSRSEHQGKRARHVYSLTESGEAALHQWLTSADSPMWELRDEGLLQLFFSGSLTIAEVIERLRIIGGLHRLAVERLQEIEPLASEFPATLLTQRMGLAVRGAAVDWCEAMIERLSAVDPEAVSADVLRDLI